LKSFNIAFLCFASSSTAIRIQLNFHSNSLRTYASCFTANQFTTPICTGVQNKLFIGMTLLKP